MTERSKPYLGWKALAFTELAMVGGIALALLLIPPLNLRAAIQGGIISIGAVVTVQLAQRFMHARRRK